MSNEIGHSNHIPKVIPQHTGWLTEGILDPEYKEYVLLAWLQKVKAELQGNKLYPALADVIRRHKALTTIKKAMEQGKDNGPVTGLDFTRLQLLRSRLQPLSSIEEYLRELIDRSLPHLNATMQEGKSLYDLIDAKVDFAPIGVQPLHLAEGYLIVTHGEVARRHLMVYRFAKSRVQRAGDAFLELSLKRIESRALSPVETADAVKWKLIRKHRDLPQPATFHAHMDWSVPVEPTLLPIARRRLLREIAQC
ncbi:MAG: hypothetical protein L7S63_02225 [Flavobacteriales bacterium]|nr:hypothetical protein [Flavobacteriales bacterium]